MKFIHPQFNDKFAYSIFGEGGFFIEAGAGNIGDATLILEKEYKWNGILIEPVEKFLINLRNKRNCIIDDSLLWSNDNLEKEFLVCNDDLFYSSIQESIPESKKQHIETLNYVKVKKITNTLNNIISKYKVNKIDYICLDAEGSEYEILSTFNFDHIRPKLISTEDNRSHKLLLSKSYIEISNPYKPSKYNWEYYYLDNSDYTLKKKLSEALDTADT